MGTVDEDIGGYGVTQHNLMAFEYTYVHWYQQLEHVPMSLETEQLLAPLYKVELQSFLADFHLPWTLIQGVIEEILVDALTNIRNFISSLVELSKMSEREIY